MYLSSKSLKNSSSVDGTPCPTGYYDLRDDYGILDADFELLEKHALKYEFLQEIEENENPHATCDLSCDCSEFLLESGSAEIHVLDFTSSSKETLNYMMEMHENAIESVFPYTSRTFPIARLDHATVSQNSSVLGRLDTTDYLNTSLNDQKFCNHEMLFDQQNLIDLGNVSDIMDAAFNENDFVLIPENEMSERVLSTLLSISVSGALVTEAAKDDGPCGNEQTDLIERSQGIHAISEQTNGSFMTTKRLHKPTQRYIEETSEVKNRCSYDRLRMPVITSNEKPLYTRVEENHRWSDAMQLLNQEYAFSLQPLTACQKNSTKTLGSGSLKEIPTITDSELQDVASDESVTSKCRRRKHHRQWTPSEVLKLVDGVSQLGVGRWTEIKMLQFSASAHRTPIDLKDKWRNLLRAASAADSQPRNLMKAQKKHGSALYLPQSVLQRVRDLSITHPYPRNRRLRIADMHSIPEEERANASVNLRSSIFRRQDFSHWPQSV